MASRKALPLARVRRIIKYPQLATIQITAGSGKSQTPAVTPCLIREVCLTSVVEPCMPSSLVKAQLATDAGARDNFIPWYPRDHYSSVQRQRSGKYRLI